MPYQQEYDYGGYQGYGQAQQTQTYQTNYQPYQNGQQQQHPMVVIPQQPRQDLSQYYTPQQSFQTQYQPDLYQQYTPQYAQTTHQQYYYPQTTQFYSAPEQQHPQLAQSQNLPHAQVSSQHVQSQASYRENQFIDPRRTYSGAHGVPSSQPQYAQPVQKVQMSPQLPSSPDPLSTHQYQVQSRAPSQPQQRQQPAAVKPQQRSQPPQRVSSESHHAPNSSQQRVVARVEIPVQQANANSGQFQVGRSPKRRRSNDGNAVPVYEQPKPKPQQRSSQHHPSQHTISSPLTELPSSQLPPTPEPKVDCQAVLLALADEYITVAYSMSASLVDSNYSDESFKEYDTLMATAMGCLESALTNYKQADFRTEARIRLRLASLMADETENDQEIEELLSKGIAACERSRLSDLKYAMHHVLIRVTFKTRPKAALKSIDKLVYEVETLRLTHWMYTFRFLRVSLGLQDDGLSDHTAISKHLSAIMVAAEESRDVSVQILAAILEAIVHIRSGSPESIQLAQRALASARTHQLGPEMQSLPQARGLLDSIDLACSLLEFNHDQIPVRMQQMQTNMDEITREPGWQKDGTIAIKLSGVVNEELEKDTCGIMRRSPGGDALLMFSWITKVQLYGLGYLLSGIANLPRSISQAEKFLDDAVTSKAPDLVRRSLRSATEDSEKWTKLRIANQLQQIFVSCYKYDWLSARDGTRQLRTDYSKQGVVLTAGMARTLLYLEALCQHGLGELQPALNLYSSNSLTFDPAAKISSAEKDLRVLATLNRIFILRSFGSQEFAKAGELIVSVESYCLEHANKAIRAVYFIIKATGSGSNVPFIKVKQYLQAALDASKLAANNHLLSICMNTMVSNYFQNIVGDQAENAAKTGRTLAKKGNDNLWVAVADGMFGDIKERCGKAAEAQAARAEAAKLVSELPESLKNSLYA